MAFFEPAGDRFVATEHTQGPWTAGAQHGGPPAALLTRAIERAPGLTDATIGRLTFEILGPVPVGPVSVSATVERAGRSVELVAGELVADGRVAMRVRAWRIRAAELDLPAISAPPPELPPAETPFREAGWLRGYLDAMEWRTVTKAPGASVTWARPKMPLVAGEESSPLQRLVAVADSTNGLSAGLDLQDWWFIPPELTIHLRRRPVGEWFCVFATSTYDPGGSGLAEGVLHDSDGPVGRSAQALLVGRR